MQRFFDLVLCSFHHSVFFNSKYSKMEQTNITQDAEIVGSPVNAEQKPKAKKPVSQKTKMTEVKVIASGSETKGNESSTLFYFDFSNLAKGVGQMLNEISAKATFKLCGKLFTVPALTANNSNKERAAAIFKQAITNFFPADMAQYETLPDSSEQAKVLLTLKSAGFKFSTVCKKELSTAINVRMKFTRLHTNIAAERARKLNRVEIAAINKLQPVYMKLKEQNLQAIEKIEKQIESKAVALLAE
jgi:hypothetical protein